MTLSTIHLPIYSNQYDSHIRWFDVLTLCLLNSIKITFMKNKNGDLIFLKRRFIFI
ncbi:hypothetical protein PROSTU_02073 [Providencia stuartii ATCC 25827]|uniref:Uncharacterized protein n=1 Tax=Providencia stuartii ATCC 25827 TaxID=471874 RepID=A0AA87CQF8_PROST|nr:hypothetical protein PROSTU_02073 [Providencia stuartii ATCC 25827]